MNCDRSLSYARTVCAEAFSFSEELEEFAEMVLHVSVRAAASATTSAIGP